MSRLSVAVVDDDPQIGQTIRGWIEATRPETDVRLYESAEAILADSRPCNIVLIDIRMRGADGIEAVRRLQSRQNGTIFIFISALKEHVFKAMDVHPFHFLLKPIDRIQLLRVIEEARDVIAERERRTGRRLLVTTRQMSVSVPVSEILYIDRCARKLQVHTRDNVYEMYGALDRIEADLAGSGFCRTHRAYLVNLAWVRSYTADCIKLETGETVFLSRKRYAQFTRDYMWYLQGSHGSV